MELKWQEKVFSPKELKYYSNLSNLSSNSLRDKKFHELAKSLALKQDTKEGLWLSTGAETTQAPWQLYSVTELDMSMELEDLSSPIERNYGVSNGGEQETGSNVRLIPDEEESGFFKRWLRVFENDENIDCKDAISRERLKKASMESWQMQVRCAFRLVDQLTGFVEIFDVKLASLRAFGFGLLQMKPGLSSDYPKQVGIDDIFSPASERVENAELLPYRIRLKNGDEYEFWLENASGRLSPAEEEQEWRIYSEFMARQLAQKQSAQVSLFASTPFKVNSRKPGLHLSVFGELRQAVGFDHPNLMLQWTVSLPDSWFVSSSNLDLFPEENNPVSKQETSDPSVSELSGWTQVSLRGKTSANEFYFNCPFSFELRTPFDHPTIFPTFYVQAISTAPFPITPARNLVLGYGAASIVPESGTTSEIIHCWRPLGNAKNEMRRWFFGDLAGETTLRSMEHSVGMSPEFRASKGKVLSRLGLPTQTAGKVVVTMNKVLRTVSSSYSDSGADEMTPSAVQSPLTIKNNAIDANGKSVVQALNKARLRLQQIRSEIDTELSK